LVYQDHGSAARVSIHCRLVINVSVLLLAPLETRWVNQYNILHTDAKKAVASGDVLFLPAANLLNLIGLIDHRPETDVWMRRAALSAILLIHRATYSAR
jgi:hypothetical protein